MFRFTSWVRRGLSHSAVLLGLAIAAPATAQVSGPSLLIGPNTATSSETAHIEGIRDRSFGSGTINHLTVDSNGDVFFDTQVPRKNTTETITALWNFNAGLQVQGITTLSASGGILGVSTPATFAGNVISSTGGVYARGSVPLTASGVTEVRIGKGGAFDVPTVILEQAGQHQWNIDSNAGGLRMFRRNSSGNLPEPIPFQIDGNMIVGPWGKRILPLEPYGVDLGSQQYKFGALWTGDLYADRLVTIENIGTIDNRWLIGNGNLLDADLSASGTSMITRYNNYLTGTFIYLQKFGKTEFIKTTSGPTLTNKVTNGSFESGTTAWTGTSATLTTSTAKTFHGEWSMLVDATAGSGTLASFGSFSFTTGTNYTFCFVARRVDGATLANGAVSVLMRDAAFVDVNPQQTQTDAWARFCRSAAAGSSVVSTVPVIDTKGVDMYIDSVQIEETLTERPYSEYRASYSISRNEDAGAGNAWYAGDGMFGVGKNTGDGWIDCYAIRGIKSATEQGPACVVNVRTGSSFNSWGPRAIWGNMDGLYGYSATTYGFAAGESAAAWIAFDSTNGVRGMHGSTKKFGVDMAGVATFIEGAFTVDNLGPRLHNTATSTDQAKSYSFTGALTYTKRPLLGYLESGGAGTIVLSSGDRSSGNAHVLIEAPVGDVTIGSTDFDVNITAGDDLNLVATDQLTIDGLSTQTVTFTCPAGQAVRSMIVHKGYVRSVSCSAP